jgi:hypothetical protein
MSFVSGCGVTVNQSAVSSPGNGSGGQGAGGTPTGYEGQAVPKPQILQPLIGCSNPNLAEYGGDWGVGSNPVYTVINNTGPVVGTPLYQANAIFWASREAAPGQSILLTGAFTDGLKKVRLAAVPDGTLDWQSIVRTSSTVIVPTQMGTTGLVFTVPPTFPAGVYGFEIVDPSADPVFGLANQPSLTWAIGVPTTSASSEALQHEVYDCGVDQGAVLRLFGKNFSASNQVVLQDSNGVAYPLNPSRLDSNSAAITIPATLAAGVYAIWIGRSPWSVASSPAAQITVRAPQVWKTAHFGCPGLVGDGTTDNTQQLQKCLDIYAPLPGTQLITILDIPAGTFLITGGVVGRQREVVSGASASTTKLIGKPRGTPPTAWFSLPQYFGIINLSLQAPANPTLLRSAGTTDGNPATSGHLFFKNVNFESTADASNGRETMFAIAGPDIQVYDSTFLSGSNQNFDVTFADGALISGNQFILNNFTGLSIGNSQNVIFENNQTSSQNTPGQGEGGHSGGSGLSIGRSNNQFGPSALSRNIYVGYSKFFNMGSPDQQVITNDGDGGAYLGTVASSTDTTVVLANDPAWNWMGVTNPEAAVFAISFGTGIGQYSFLKSYSGRTLSLEKPLKVLPDSDSIVGIVQYEQNMTIANNTFTNTLGDAIVLGDALDGVIEDNKLTDAGGGILISAYGPYGGPAGYGPVMNTDVLRNTISVGDAQFINPDWENYLWGIGIQDMPGCTVSGLMIRNNAVPSINVIYSTDGVNGVSANVVEQNYANWSPAFPTPGFLIQDNYPPSE